MRMINAKSEYSKILVYSSVFLLIIFILMMVQNVIRYSSYDTYDPWISILYLSISLLFFIPLLPFAYKVGRRILSQKPKLYVVASIALSAITILVFFALSNIVLFLTGYYDFIPDSLYASRYFGREALFHLLVLAAGFYLIKTRTLGQLKVVSGTLGRKEVTISTDLIRWIESDDHYLKIHTEESSLMKRSTLEQMAEELKPKFIRIHRKYLVNKDQIVGKEKQQRDEFVILKSGERLKVGRSYRPLEI